MCVKELHNLFVSCICLAIEINSVVVTHDKNAKIITYYEAEYDYTIGSFEHPTEGTLYQFQLIVIFQEGSLCNGSPFGDGFKVKIKPPKACGPGGNGSGDTTHIQPLQSWKYLSGNQYRVQPGQEKKKRR